MKLLRYGKIGQEKPGIIDDDGLIRDLSSVINDVEGKTITPESLSQLAKIDYTDLPIVSNKTRIGPCVNKVGKFICIGLNYSDHAKETGAIVPPEPTIFAKFPSAICGPNDPVIIPKGSSKTDWEVELGVIIGQPTKYVSEIDALNYVAGYCVINDISERSYQLERSGQWVKGKSCDNFAPLGPYLVTSETVVDPQNLSLWLEVDGHRYQDGNTKTMVYSVAYLVSYLSQFFTLYPGDIISTGTPPGVGLGQLPEPIYLKAGQNMRLGIEGLGEQNQITVDDLQE